jgi:small subunit ribosomal protein S20
MPNTRSAAKRLRQTKTRTARRRAVKSAMKTQIKKVASAAAAGDIEKAEAEFRLAAKKIDQTAAKKVIHKNTAARSKSRLSRLIKTAKSESA